MDGDGKFDFSKLNIDIMRNTGIEDQIRKSQAQIEKNAREIMRANQEKIEREELSIKLQMEGIEEHKKLVQLQEKQNELIENLGADAKSIYVVLKKLELIAYQNGKIIEANMLIIEEELEKIIKNTEPEKLEEAFINAAKQQVINYGVDQGLVFLVSAIKTLFLCGAV